MTDPPRKPEDLPTFAEGTTAADAPTFSPDALTVSDTAVTFAQGMAVTAAALPATIGRYRIVRLIGEGGMGAVYEAEQDQPRRTVALKVIKPGLASPELLRRFAQEAQVLGRLQHPGIAQIYEAGTADTGFGSQPYFAMEFIRGAALRDYADSRHLGLRERLELMVRICEAVQHAHQRGVIHRDLKPGNIIVDEAGQPKVLDFGVARVTDSDTQATLQTDVGQLVGTLNYMSPEQVLADPLDIDTRSDVYALGVILYELLSGRLPYQISKRLHEAMQTIREEEPSQAEHDRSPLSRRHRDDCRQGAREGQDEALLVGRGTRSRHHALPEGRADHRAAADHELSAAEVCPPAQGTGRRGGRSLRRAGRRRRRQLVAGDSRQPG